MPYANIVWIKLKLEILSDYRFTDKLSDHEKLIFIALLLLAGDTNNSIPSDPLYIRRRLNIQATDIEINSAINKIISVFPKTIIKNGFIMFLNFSDYHNFVAGMRGETLKEFQRKSKGNPKALSEKRREEKIKRREDKEKRREDIPSFPYLSDTMFLSTFNDYLKNRKKKASDRAKNLILKDLHKFSQAEAVAMLEQSIKNGWIGVFPLKKENSYGKNIGSVGQVTRSDKYAGVEKSV